MNYTVKGSSPGTIFCIHGNSSSSRVFKDLIESDLVTQSKIAVDLLGHGKNNQGISDRDELTFEANKKFLLKILNKIEDDILLIGNSLGGHLAIEIAPSIKRLKGIVIMGTPPVKKPLNFEEAFISIPELNCFFKEEVAREEIVSITEVALVNSDKKRTIIDDFQRSNPWVRSTLANDVSRGAFGDQHNIFTNLNLPKYIIAGTEDPTVNKEYLKRVQQESKFGCRFIEFDNCGHYPSLDRSEEFIETIHSISQELFNLA